MTFEILVYCPTRDLFIEGMTTTQLPDGRTLASKVEYDLPVEDQLDEDGKVIPPVDEDGNPIPPPKYVQLIPVDGVQMDEIGPIVKTPAVLSEDGEEITPAIIIEGHHVNFRVYGDLAAMLTQGLPQFNEDGTPKSLFERTHILSLIPGLEWQPITEEGVPAGYEGPNQVRLFDPNTVNNRARVWA